MPDVEPVHRLFADALELPSEDRERLRGELEAADALEREIRPAPGL